MLLRIALVCLSTALVALPQAATFPDMVREAKTHIKEISAEELKALLAANEKLILVDVREDAEWAAGHAASAIHIGRGVLERDIAGVIPQRDARIVLYCGGGFRSALAADTLARMGYTNVVSLAGGFRDYQKVGLAVQK